MRTANIDNDVIYKIVAYGLMADFFEASPFGIGEFGALGSSRYIVAKKLKKKPPVRGYPATIAELEFGFSKIGMIEPTEAEIALAAELEFGARDLDVDLDPGESILCATMLTRGINYVVTGDKRAIIALHHLLANQLASSELGSRLICLEQIFRWLLETLDAQHIRDVVCADRDIDKAITNCFGCYSTDVSVNSCITGLRSYIDDLEKNAPGALYSFA